MDIGMMAEPVNRSDGDTRPLVELYDAALDRILWLEDQGLDFIMVGEHHFMPSQWNPSPLMLLAALARRTSRLRLSTNVLLTPFYNPIRLAEDVATLDLLSHGRLDLVCGTASVTEEFETYGVDPSERHGRTFETMDFLRRCFSGEEVFDHQGRYFHFPHVRMTTQPVQQPLPIWFGGFGPKNIERAGRHGFHLTAPFSPAYEQGLRAGGHDPDQFNTCARAAVLVVATEQEADSLRPELEAYERAQAEEYWNSRDLAFENLRSRGQSAQPSQRTFIGTPDQVLRQLEPRLKDCRDTHLIGGNRAHHATDGMARYERSVQLYLKEVAPVLRTWGRQPVRSHATAVVTTS